MSALNLTLGVFVTEDGQVLEITNMFDCDGQETDELDEVVSLVAGPTADGSWLSIDRRDYKNVNIN